MSRKKFKFWVTVNNITCILRKERERKLLFVLNNINSKASFVKIPTEEIISVQKYFVNNNNNTFTTSCYIQCYQTIEVHEY